MMTFNNIIDLRNQKVMTQLVLLKEYINMSSFSKARLMCFIRWLFKLFSIVIWQIVFFWISSFISQINTLTKNRVVYIPRKFFKKCKFYKFPNKEIIIDNFDLTLLILLIISISLIFNIYNYYHNYYIMVIRDVKIINISNNL